MFYQETLNLFKIINSLDENFLTLMPEYSSNNEERKLSYKKQENVIVYDLRYDYITESGAAFTYASPTPLGTHIHQMSPPTITAPTTTSSPTWTMTSSGSITITNNDTVKNKCIRVVVGADNKELVSVNWYICYTNNMYIISSNHRTTDDDILGKPVMNALFLRDNKTLIDSKLYDLDESADAFIEDVDNISPFSKLQIMNLREKFNE